MAEAQVKLGYIIEPFAQFENLNGKPVVGGHIEVYEARHKCKIYYISKF